MKGELIKIGFRQVYGSVSYRRKERKESLRHCLKSSPGGVNFPPQKEMRKTKTKKEEKKVNIDGKIGHQGYRQSSAKSRV